MSKHEHSIKIDKIDEGFTCNGCGKSCKKGIRITTEFGVQGEFTVGILNFCHKCKSWIKGKLQGF